MRSAPTPRHRRPRPPLPTIAMPAWCRPGCRHLRDMPRHHRPHLLTCTWRLSPGKWCLGRIDRMTSCPLAENAQKRPGDGATAKGRLPLAPEAKMPLAGTGPSRGAFNCGHFGARPSRAENIYHSPENHL
jgi:hypothetical protein